MEYIYSTYSWGVTIRGGIGHIINGYGPEPQIPDPNQTPKTGLLLFAEPLRFIDQTEGVLIYAAPVLSGRLPRYFSNCSQAVGSTCFPPAFPFQRN